MSLIDVDNEVKSILESLRREGESLNDVIKRLIYHELSRTQMENEISEVSHEEWLRVSQEVLNKYHDILEKLAK